MTGIRRALSLLFPKTAVVELRALADYHTHSGYFDDYAELAEKAGQISRLSGVHGVYVTLNEVNPALLSRRANRVKMKLGRKDATTADADIIRRRWLPVDLDPVRPSGVSSTDEEHEAAIAKAEKIAGFLETIGFPRPVIADSGNGAHLLYPIDLPNDDESTELVRDCLTTLDALFSDETVIVDAANYNAARIWKLYGTMSRKGDDTPDRPHRMAEIIEAPEEREAVEAETLQRLATLLPKDEPKPAAKKGEKTIDLSGWLSEHGISVASERPWQGGTLFVLDECPFSSAHKDGAFAIQFDNGAIYAGCHHNSCGGGKQRWGELRGMFEIKSGKTNRAKGKDNRSSVTEGTEKETFRGSHSFPESVRKKAAEILKTGDPYKFMLETFARLHVGDETVAECLIMSIASQSVENTKGLHVSISGNSGKGKSHACKSMLKLVPKDYRLSGTVSDKALFYNRDLKPGTIFLFDDVTLSDDLSEVLKSSTANFCERIEHQTLTSDRQLKICSLPERCVWWLAKVESPGDDQVMNRMLTTWIDDSAEQDEKVLNHLKKCETLESIVSYEPAGAVICRCIWAMLKEERIYVSIPFAEQVQFSNSFNRRNPAILFDLIKCHALLFREQREKFSPGDEDVSGAEITAIRATADDFKAATGIYAKINNDSGGQETKVTKNEAAALKIIYRMGWEVVTLRMLQDVMGLSHYQARRIFHGYSNGGNSYSGLLEKCPAIGFMDATVSQEGDCSYVRRRENHYSFNPEVYKGWSSPAQVWIDETRGFDSDDGDDFGDDPSSASPDVCTCAPGMHRMCTGEVHTKKEEQVDSFTDLSKINKNYLLNNGSVHQNKGTQDRSNPSSSPSSCVCSPCTGADLDEICMIWSPDQIYSTQKSSLKCTQEVHGSAHGCTGADVSGRSPNNSPGGLTLPLPGVLDHRDFGRVHVELGKCDLCGEGKAVFSSKDLKMSICEGCFGRLLREDLRGEGVR